MVVIKDTVNPGANYIHPLEDRRWNEFVKRHPCSSVFHTVQWLEALRRTYGFEPVVITTSPPGIELQNGLLFCRVNSWLTGRRLVSLPFSDHCDPLVGDDAELSVMLSALEQQLREEGLRYLEIRLARALAPTLGLTESTHQYCFHQIDLTPDLETLFHNCHRSSTQRKIRRAETEGLVCEEGRSKTLLDMFYRLLILTRRRHRLPPQPKRWFQNLIECLGESLKIRVALKDRQPVASILTMQHKNTLVYKYGCSDVRFKNLGGIHLLLWRSIEEAKRDGLRVMDLGRSDCENNGLITFKDRWGSARSVLCYPRFSSADSTCHFLPGRADWKQRVAGLVLAHLPDRLLSSVGDVMYKHTG